MKNPMASSNASSVLVYDAMPGLATTHLLGEFNASAEELTFDCTKGTTSVYVVGKDAAGKIIAADYYPVSSTICKQSHDKSWGGNDIIGCENYWIW